MRSWWLVAVGMVAVPMSASAADIASPIDGGITAAVIISLHDAETIEVQSDRFVGKRTTSLEQRAHARSDSSAQYVEGLSAISATWASADRGTIEFQLEGEMSAECCGNSVYSSSPSRVALDDWHYTFVAKTNGVFRLGYRLSGTGAGAGGYSVSINGVANDHALSIPADGTTLTNSQDFQLVAGQTYTFAINNLAGFSSAESTPTRFVSSANFTFEIVSPAEELLADLIQDVSDLELKGGAFDSELKSALAAVERSEPGVARTLLKSFITSAEAQRGKALTDAQDDALIAAAQEIIDSLSPP